MLITQCAWCDRVKFQNGIWMWATPRLHQQITHGICPTCVEFHAKPEMEIELNKL